jgi:hypothetical protein
MPPSCLVTQVEIMSGALCRRKFCVQVVAADTDCQIHVKYPKISIQTGVEVGQCTRILIPMIGPWLM